VLSIIGSVLEWVQSVGAGVMWTCIGHMLSVVVNSFDFANLSTTPRFKFNINSKSYRSCSFFGSHSHLTEYSFFGQWACRQLVTFFVT